MSLFEEKYKPFGHTWSYGHFASSEFDSPDLPGSGKYMSQVFIEKLEELRINCNFPFTINSGFRTPSHNQQIGGKTNSTHMLGLAADIHCDDSQQRYQLIYRALLCGFRRIGIYPTFIHLDISQESPGPNIWMS